MVPIIKVAVELQKPPLAVLFEDDERGWTMWDYRLVKALRTHEDMMTGTGVPIYWDRSDRVRFEAGSFISKSRAALDIAEEKAAERKQKNYGKTFYPIPHSTDGGPLPTLEEFIEEQRIRREMMAGNIKISGDKFSNAQWKPKDKGIEL